MPARFAPVITAPASFPSSPLDLALLGRIHLLTITAAQQYGLDLTVEELPRLRVTGIQPVVVDQKRLMLEPLGPTDRTDLLLDTIS
jgi:hypothetical protein